VLAVVGLLWVVAPRGLIGFVLAYLLPVVLFAAGILALSSLMRAVTLDAPWTFIYILYRTFRTTARPLRGILGFLAKTAQNMQ
jgi:hypothetical protein